MAVILDGKETSAKIVEEMKAEVASLKTKGVTPTLALILVGTDPGSTRYVNLKVKRAEEAGIATQFHHFENTTTEQVVELIKKLNADPKVHGIMVQLPAPGVNEGEIVETIDPEKDVDALSPVTFGKIVLGEKSFLPAGIEAVMELLRRYNIDTEGKHWVVAGLPSWLGKPLVAMLLNKKVQVTAFAAADDSHLPELVKLADVLCIEVHKKWIVAPSMLKKGVVVIDNGNSYEGKKVFGDVDYEGALPIASAITPVPGGVGPLLITMLLKNTVKAASA